MFGILTQYGRSLPNDCRLSYSRCVSIREAASRPDELASFVQREARQAMADMIASARMRRIEGDHSIEFRCEVYVFNPDDFWGIVQEAAIELNRMTRDAALALPAQGEG